MRLLCRGACGAAAILLSEDKAGLVKDESYSEAAVWKLFPYGSLLQLPESESLLLFHESSVNRRKKLYLVGSLWYTSCVFMELTEEKQNG